MIDAGDIKRKVFLHFAELFCERVLIFEFFNPAQNGVFAFFQALADSWYADLASLVTELHDATDQEPVLIPLGVQHCIQAFEQIRLCLLSVFFRLSNCLDISLGCLDSLQEPLGLSPVILGHFDEAFRSFDHLSPLQVEGLHVLVKVAEQLLLISFDALFFLRF